MFTNFNQKLYFKNCSFSLKFDKYFNNLNNIFNTSVTQVYGQFLHDSMQIPDGILQDEKIMFSCLKTKKKIIK